MDEDFARQVQLPVLFVLGVGKHVLTSYPRSRIMEFENGSVVPFLYEKHLHIAPSHAVPVVYRAYFARSHSGVQEVFRSEGVHLVRPVASKNVGHRKRNQFSLKMGWLVGEWLSSLLKSKPQYHSALTLQIALSAFFDEGTTAGCLQRSLARWQETDRLETKIGQLGIPLYRWRDGAQNESEMPGDLRLRRSPSAVSSVLK